MAWLGVKPVTNDLQRNHSATAPLNIFCELIASNKLCMINTSWKRGQYLTFFFLNRGYNSNVFFKEDTLSMLSSHI